MTPFQPRQLALLISLIAAPAAYASIGIPASDVSGLLAGAEDKLVVADDTEVLAALAREGFFEQGGLQAASAYVASIEAVPVEPPKRIGRRLQRLPKVPALVHVAVRPETIERLEQLRVATRAEVLQQVTPAVDIELPDLGRVARLATPTERVLRHLEAMRSAERNEVGAIRLEQPTHAERVLATLADLSGPGLVPISEELPKRMRKLQARALADVAAGVVDIPLPLDKPAASPFGEGSTTVAAASLDRVRGGFAGENGLNVSFGIERAVYINGALVTSTSMNVTQLGQAVAGRAGATIDPGTMALIQSGNGNSVATGALSSSATGAVIQNTVDGQKIQNVTTINATVNSLGIFRGINLGASMRGAVIDSLRR